MPEPASRLEGPRCREAPTREALVALGRRLRELRGARSQQDVAQAAGITRGYLSELEGGKRPRPRARTLASLAAALGSSLEAIRSVAPLSPSPPKTVETGTVIEPRGAARSGTYSAIVRRSDMQGGDLIGGEPPPPTPQPGGAGPPDDERASVASLFPVYRWGTLGDPRDPEDAPVPFTLERVPRGNEPLVGPDAFAIKIRGDSLTGWRVPVYDGDKCWVNPNMPAKYGRLAGVLVEEADGRRRLAVYELARREDGTPYLRAHTEGVGSGEVYARRFTLLGRVVGIMSWRSPDEGRADPDPLGLSSLPPTAVPEAPEGARPPPAPPGRGPGLPNSPGEYPGLLPAAGAPEGGPVAQAPPPCPHCGARSADGPLRVTRARGEWVYESLTCRGG